MKRISNKKAKDLAEYTKEKQVWIKAHPVCERCGDQSTDLHHSRGRIGRLLRAEVFWMPLCRYCHTWVHENPKDAREHGYICEEGEWNTYPDE